MYKIMIVEDEQIERESLKNLMEELKPQISEIIVAENGEQGYKKYLDYHPDIILTDIYMPKLDGLEMIEKIRETNQEVICLILTSYNYFNYAQKAIRLKVEDFILKPVDNETLKQSIYKCINKIQEKELFTETSLRKKVSQAQKILESECFYSIMIKHDKNSIEESFEMLGYEIVSGYCVVFNHIDQTNGYLKILKQNLEYRNYLCILGTLQKEDILFVLSTREIKKNEQQLISKILNMQGLFDYEYGMGNIKYKVSNLYKSYQEALYQLNFDKNFVQFEKSEMIELTNSCVKEILHNIEDGSYLEHVREFSITISNYDPQRIEEILDLFINKLVEETSKLYNINFKLSEFQYTKNNYYNNLILDQILIKNIDKLKKVVIDQKYKNSSYLIKKGIQYIEKNYKNQISLNDVADKLNVSTFYISKIFSKEGYNFTEIVNDMRINEAKRLIKEGYSFKEAAFEVGFGSQSYFTKIFKKKVGCSPKEYRNMN